MTAMPATAREDSAVAEPLIVDRLRGERQGAGRERHVPDVQRQAEEMADRRRHPEEEAERDVRPPAEALRSMASANLRRRASPRRLPRGWDAIACGSRW